MRSVVALALALSLAPVASSTQAEARDALAVSIVYVQGAGALITWSPAPDVTSYTILRGPTVEDAEKIGESDVTAFFDGSPPVDGEFWYVIVANNLVSAPGGSGDVEYRGACVTTSSHGIAITASNCVPTHPI